MYSERRSLERAILGNKKYRSASFVQREVYIGLVLLADDEGRFVADAFALMEKIFSRRHRVSENDVDSALDWWNHPNQGCISLYEVGGVRYGVLTGWHEHQYIEPNKRESSSYPAPPTLINSWEMADHIYHWHCSQIGRSRTHYRTALRAFGQYDERNQEIIVSQLLANSGRSPQATATPAKAQAEATVPTPAVPSAKARKAEREAALVAERDTLMAGLPDIDRTHITMFLENCANANESKTLTIGRECNEVKAAVTLREELVAKFPANGIDRWRYGMEAMNRKTADKIGYAKKAAYGWTQQIASQEARRSGTASSGHTHEEQEQTEKDRLLGQAAAAYAAGDDARGDELTHRAGTL